MKKYWIILVVLLLFLTPFILRTKDGQKPLTEQAKKQNACEFTITVNGQQLPIEEYVVGVVAGEMPAAYEMEALKAQAIATRTYAIHKLENGETELKASVAHQVFYDDDQRTERWKTSAKKYEKKVQQAVQETTGQIVTYNGETISAMFHAASNGQTESAKNYSGQDIPYLQSVSSPEKETTTQNISSKRWSAAQLQAAQFIRNDSGRVQQAIIAGEIVTGRELRDVLELRSTDFKFSMEGDEIVVTTKGYGHGVGMSQQGAQEMALQGQKANEILQHYYTGTKITQVSCES